MPRFFMQLRDSTDEILDPDGIEYDSIEALRDAVIVAARDMLSADLRRGVIDLRFRIDAEDDGGSIVYSLPFEQAFSIIPGEG
jgi:hypothetical protein